MPYINVDEAYILDNTGLQVDQVVDIPYTDAALTDGQKEQARKNIAAGGTNPNLLDNPWWNSGNVINQRGFTNGTSSGYTIDRWALTNSSVVTATLGASGMTIAKAGTGSYTFFQQWINTEIDRDATYTLSIMDSDGNIYSATRQFVTGAGSESYVTINGMNIGFGLYNKEATHPRVAFYFGTSQTGSVTFKAVKLELGTVSTLANDAPPNYAEELAKCQYYCPVIDFPTYGTIATGYATTSTAAYFIISLPANIRTLPTMTYSGSLRVFSPSSNTSVSVSSLAVGGSTNTPCANQIALSVTVASGLTAGQLVVLGGYGTAGKIVLSADL